MIRVHNVIGAAIGDLMGYLVASFWEISVERLAISMIVVSLVAAGGYAINDVFDVEIDKINKPDRPLPSGKISLRRAIILSYGLMISGTIISITLGYFEVIIATITSLALYYYAKTLKREGLSGNIIVATTTALSIFYGGITYFSGDWLERVIVPTAYSFLLTLGREFIKGIEDYEGDKAYGVKTLATTIGVRDTWKISRIILILILVISPLPLFLGFNIMYLILLIPFVYFILLSIFSETSIKGGSKGREYLKWSAFIGITAFALGSLPLHILI
nr:UbiA family prenyltransferase [Acidianus sp. RZ1]